MQGIYCVQRAVRTTAGALVECVIHSYVYPLAVFAEVRLFVIATDFMERVAVTICHSIASSASDAAAVYRGAHSRDIKHRKNMHFRAFFTEVGQQSLKLTFELAGVVPVSQPRYNSIIIVWHTQRRV